LFSNFGSAHGPFTIFLPSEEYDRAENKLVEKALRGALGDIGAVIVEPLFPFAVAYSLLQLRKSPAESDSALDNGLVCVSVRFLDCRELSVDPGCHVSQRLRRRRRHSLNVGHNFSYAGRCGNLTPERAAILRSGAFFTMRDN
jgi:hypothetical protein